MAAVPVRAQGAGLFEGVAVPAGTCCVVRAAILAQHPTVQVAALAGLGDGVTA
jgi:hypothetical protein